jgi:hypothetical protein
MTVKLVTRAIFITAGVYVAAIAAFTLMGATRQVALFFGGSTALMALAALMLARGVLETVGEGGVKQGGVFRLISDPFLILTPGSLGPGAKAFIAAGILYFTKIFVFGDVALGLPPLWFMLFGGG